MDSTAKEEWLQSFQGATLVLEPEFGSPKVNHMFKRNFDHLGRNAFFISVRGRIMLGEDQVSWPKPTSMIASPKSPRPWTARSKPPRPLCSTPALR